MCLQSKIFLPFKFLRIVSVCGADFPEKRIKTSQWGKLQFWDFLLKKFNIIVIIWTTFEPISEISQLVFPLWNFKIFYVKKLPTLPYDPENLNGDYFWLQTRWPQRLFPIRIFMFLVMRFETHQVIARPWKWSIT